MNEGLISKRYAKALYHHARGMSEEDVLYHRMQMLEALLRKMPDFRASIKSPMLSAKEKISLLTNATGKNPEPSYLDFIDLVVTNRRSDMLQRIALSYQRFYREKKRISVVHLISAKKLSGNVIKRIRNLTERKTQGKVEFSTHIDPSLDGGFIFRLNDIRIDASVKGQLDRISRRLVQINKSII
ncbi:MAG: F0F1 ATP synthase subunit delta [Tannerella sp.]|jgi:F-type H+-transporting ATPase subunit delta|nr:F0F1 ATP synthase subunit delta [Tannerella sp.]